MIKKLMTGEAKRNFHLIAPYAAWMVLMLALPETAWAYAARGVVSAALLVFSFRAIAFRFGAAKGVFTGIAAGCAVFAVWIAPEIIFGVSTGEVKASAASPYSPEVCGWPLTLIKLASSAFVIAAAEELFFRVWLVEFAGFWWMILLFAVEHGERWHVGAVAGLIYAFLAKKYGIYAAIASHVTTNLVLGVWVIVFERWEFW